MSILFSLFLEKNSQSFEKVPAYLSALYNKAVSLEVLESVIYQEIGISDPNTGSSGFLPKRLPVIAGILEGTEQAVMQVIQDKLAAIETGDSNILLQGPEGDQIEIHDIAVARETLDEMIIQPFQNARSEVSALVAEKDRVVNQMLRLVQGDYPGKQPERFLSLVVRLISHKKTLVTLYRLNIETSEIKVVEDLSSQDQVKLLASDLDVEEFVAREINVVDVKVGEFDLDLLAYNEAVIVNHFNQFLEEEK